MKDIIVEVRQDTLNEFSIHIPESILADLEWYDETKLKLQVEADGSVTLIKIIEKKAVLEEERIII